MMSSVSRGATTSNDVRMVAGSGGARMVASSSGVRIVGCKKRKMKMGKIAKTFIWWVGRRGRGKLGG